MRSRFVIPSTEKLPPAFLFPTRAAGWEFLRYLLDAIAALFGPHSELVRRIASPDFRADMFAWLRPAEKLARILLLAEAADMKIEIKGASAHKSPARRSVSETFAGEPGSWRVSFKILERPNKRGSGVRGWQAPCLNTRPLAARFEALARVLANPTPFARRLAQRLMRRPRRLRALFRVERNLHAPLMRAHEGALHLAVAARLRFDSG